MAKHSPERVPISEFKAKSLALLEQVRRTGRPIIVTKRGEPIAEVIPPSTVTLGSSWIGSARASVILGDDLVGPAGDLTDWDALR